MIAGAAMQENFEIHESAQAVWPVAGRCRRARAGCEARIVALPGGAWKDGGLARRSAGGPAGASAPARTSDDGAAPSSLERRHLNAPTRAPADSRPTCARSRTTGLLCPPALPHAPLTPLTLLNSKLHPPFQGGAGRPRRAASHRAPAPTRASDRRADERGRADEVPALLALYDPRHPCDV